MGATSVTGVSGAGDSGKATLNELSQWALGPQILVAGIASVDNSDLVSSPPMVATTTVTFPRPLRGFSDYVIILTSMNGGKAYVTDKDQEGDVLSGFTFTAETECDVMYIVTRVGFRV